MEKAWTFYRRSTDKQELSIEDQRRECRAYAASRGWLIVREFEPVKGYGSGLTIDRDPAFQEMVRLAEQGDHGIRYLLIYDVSRFGRLQQEDKIYWERRFKKQGNIETIYVKDDFKNDGSIGDTLLKIIKHSEAHQFSIKLSELTLRGAKSHAALGHSPGGVAPFGYDRLEVDANGSPVRVMNGSNDWKSNKLHRVIWTPSPIKAPIVRSLFENYERGIGLHLLADQMNSQGIPAPRGRFWSKTALHYLLRNRTYIGERIYNKRSYKGYRRGERVRLANAPENWVVKQNAHEPIIDIGLFECVQAKMKTKVTTIGRTFHRPYLLTGILRCANCGYRMIGQPVMGNGHRYLTYTCSGYLRIGKSVCRSVHVSVEELEGEVLKNIQEHLMSDSWKPQVRETLDELIAEEFGDGAAARANELGRALSEAERQIANVVDAIKISGRFSEAMNRCLVELERQRDGIREHLANAESRVNRQHGAETLANKIMDSFGNFKRLWCEGLNVEERKEVIRCYVHQVDITHSPTEVHAEIWLYKVPIPAKKMTLALNGIEPLIARVNCGGPSQTQVKGVEPRVVGLVTNRFIALKPPYKHQRKSVA